MTKKRIGRMVIQK